MSIYTKRSFKTDKGRLNNPPPAEHQSKVDASLPREQEFGTTLEEFGFHFDDKGVLRDGNGDGFVFNVSKNTFYNERRYEAMANAMIEEVYNKLQEDCGLEKIYIPEDAAETDARSFVFASSDFYSNETTLLVLIHGAGFVRAGQWSRKVIMNQGLREGSQIPYIEAAKQRGWAVIVLNTNLNIELAMSPDGKVSYGRIKYSGTPEEHGLYVWNKLIRNTKASSVFVVAHSYGGIVTAHLADKAEDFTDRVKAVALTDSVHSLVDMDAFKNVEDFFERSAINWVQSLAPVNTRVKYREKLKGKDCELRSAGVMEHDMTSHCAKESVFNWFDRIIAAEDQNSDGMNDEG
ncbi:cotranscriptional regulator ARB2A homolog isoform X2 [Symsagittifera roscoffensis]|uniref:cotranscriptional regulator ARB2A homolog isoform X2 n=1 Tax=Symsagittifera roscoffensis TaxID=84072 RepID=UPI00307C3B7E